METMIYVIIVLGATISGSITGLGGGVIIKPLFDIVGYHDVSTIGFYSSVAVFTMCIVSIYKQYKNRFIFNLKVVIAISSGSILGGFLGERIFIAATSLFKNNQIKMIQAALLGLTLLSIIIYTLNRSKIKHIKVENIFIIFLIGFLLGTISIFLGIGGGPLNVAIMMLLFSFTMKEAASYSIAIIFFSQISKLTITVLSGKILSFDLDLIPFICISAIVGGFIGTCIKNRIDNRSVEKIYNLLIYALLFVSIYNIIINFS